DPLDTVGRQAVEEGAKAAGYDLVYRYYAWSGGVLAQGQLTIDWLARNKGDKFVTIGYSWGGAACAGLARANLAVKRDFVFTIDPVNGIPGTPFPPVLRKRLKKVWYNHYQQVDNKSLANATRIRGEKIGNVNNTEHAKAEFTAKNFYLDNANKATAYPGGN